MLSKAFVKAAKLISKTATKRGSYFKSGSRDRLEFVRILDGQMTATDGRCLITEHTEDPDGWLDPSALKTADAVLTRNGTGLHADQRGTITHHEDQEDCGKFPDWRNVMPGGWDSRTGPAGYTLVARFDKAVLERVLVALSGFESGSSVPVEVWSKIDDVDRLSSVLIRGEDCQRAALAMPCRKKA